MSLTVEDGTGLADADAYCAAADVTAYWAKRNDTIFSTTDTPVQEAAVVVATQFIDAQWGDRFSGRRLVEGQALEWPRDCVKTIEGWKIEGVPKEIVRAVAELAKLALSGPLAGQGAVAQAPSQAQITLMKAGSVEIEFDKGEKSFLETDHADKFYLIERILRTLIGGGTLNTGTAR